MFQSIINSNSRVARIVLLLMCCLFALLPLAALADGGGGTEPPVQDPCETCSSGDGGLIIFGMAVLSTLMGVL